MWVGGITLWVRRVSVGPIMWDLNQTPVKAL
jgi:hypothetical protein